MSALYFFALIQLNAFGVWALSLPILILDSVHKQAFFEIRVDQLNEGGILGGYKFELEVVAYLAEGVIDYRVRLLFFFYDFSNDFRNCCDHDHFFEDEEVILLSLIFEIEVIILEVEVNYSFAPIGSNQLRG